MDNDQTITSEDKELAEMIAGLNSSAAKSTPAPIPVPPKPPTPMAAPVAPPTTDADFTRPVTPVAPATPIAPTPEPVPSPVSDIALNDVKKDVLNELKPLVDKLDLSAEEKFDTLLLLIRSTDDKSLIKPAHEAAKSITDESRRATALLDIIKEIDFFENPS